MIIDDGRGGYSREKKYCVSNSRNAFLNQRNTSTTTDGWVISVQESEFFKGLKAAAAEGGFFLMAGPNVIQSEEHCLKMCRQIKSVTGTSRDL